jgi:hypothetical protein
MRSSHGLLGIALLGAAGAALLLVPRPAAPARSASGFGAEPAAKVYGEWRIRVKPDKGADYNRLIAEQGLPLFREAGGRMVGWWTTLVGDLYEHVTVWEYDGLAGFEKAVALLGKDERFLKFAAQRDPLLAGEDSRFHRLADFGEKPSLPETARVVVHEVHRVPLERCDAYLAFFKEALPDLKKEKLRLAGPFRADLGRWSEFTCLYAYNSLEEREQRLAGWGEGARDFLRKLTRFADDVTLRVLLPAPFAK